jgi:hypothetical protein
MDAFATNVNIPGFAAGGAGASPATARASIPAIDDATAMSPAQRLLDRVIRRIAQARRRRSEAAIARLKSPLSLDDAWVGGWYGRDHALRQALRQHGSSTGATSAHDRQDWDDKLD